MDPRLLRYYNRELQHVREMGAEFAREFPKIAGRLGLEGFECADPYVERLLEGFAFLTSRVQLKLDAEFPAFIQHLLEMVYPHFLAPIPSMAVVQFHPNEQEAGLAAGLTIPRGTQLQSVTAPDERTSSDYRTAHELKLWPLQVTEARYFDSAAGMAAAGIRSVRSARAGLRLAFATTAAVPVQALALDSLPVHLVGADALPKVLHEALLANCSGLLLRVKSGGSTSEIVLPPDAVRRMGFDESEALLPYGARSFSGYRLLQEYFACPERFLFVAFDGLRQGLAQAEGQEFELVALFDRSHPALARAVDAGNFRLFCTPAINLFPHRLDRIHLEEGRTEYHVVPDRTRPMDFEIYGLTRVDGFGDSAEPEQRFLPFYSADERSWHAPQQAFYTVRREPRMLSARARAQGPRSSYVGSEVFVALVDAREAPFPHTLRQLGIEALCTNRDLPLSIPVGKSTTDFTLSSGAPVASVRCVAGPTKPRASAAHGEIAWRLLSQLSLNYLTLVEETPEEGAKGLRELLLLYCDANDPGQMRQIEGVKSVRAQQVVRRLPVEGPISYGRGLEILLTCDDAAFEGSGPYLLGAVLEEFFARYVSLNSFTETALHTLERGPIARFRPRTGRRLAL